MGGMPGMPGMPGMAGRRRHDYKPPLPYAIPVGTTIVVRNLAKQAEHNGKTGRVLRFDDSKGRYDVELAEGSAVLSLRPQHITAMQRGGDWTRKQARTERLQRWHFQL